MLASCLQSRRKSCYRRRPGSRQDHSDRHVEDRTCRVLRVLCMPCWRWICLPLLEAIRREDRQCLCISESRRKVLGEALENCVAVAESWLYRFLDYAMTVLHSEPSGRWTILPVFRYQGYSPCYGRYLCAIYVHISSRRWFVIGKSRSDRKSGGRDHSHVGSNRNALHSCSSRATPCRHDLVLRQ